METLIPTDTRTMRQQVIARTNQLINDWLLEIVSDDVTLMDVVAQGEYQHRQTFLRAFRGLPVNDEVANGVYRFCRQKFREKWPAVTPGQMLDSVEIISPPTPQEIEDAWVHEIASSESAMRRFYEGSARVRRGADVGRPRGGGKNVLPIEVITAVG